MSGGKFLRASHTDQNQKERDCVPFGFGAGKRTI